MPNPNINSGAPGNPLDALLGDDPLNGSLGMNLENVLAQARSGNIDPRLYGMGFQRSPFSESNNFEFNPTDPNVSASQGRVTINGKQYVQLNSTSMGGPGEPKDPSQVIKDPKYGLLTPVENIKPISSGYGDMVFALASLGLAGPTLAAAMGGAGAAGAAGSTGAGGADAAGLGLDLSPIGYTSAGQVTPLVGDPAGLGAIGEGAGGGAAAGAGGGGGGLGAGGLDPETLAGQGGMSVAQNGIGPGTIGDALTGAMNNPSSLMSSQGPLARAGSSIGSSIASNPLQAARLGMGLAALGAGATGSKPTGGAAGSDMGSIIEQMAQANRVNQTTPIGSRQWTHNPDGSWSVNDSMSAPEQENFTNVQGLNAGVTGMGRDRLAAFLANPYDFNSATKPLLFGGRSIGGP